MKVHTLKNNQIQISINSFGAELCSVKTADGKELIWQADKNIWPRHAPVLFPVVGKLKDNQFKFGSREYAMLQHGFSRDKEFVLVRESENSLEFELSSDEEMLLNYPFHFLLSICYELKGGALTIKYKVFNPNNSVLLFSLGAHPGFNCKRLKGETLNDFYLEFVNKNELVAQKLKDGLISDETFKIDLQNGRLKLNVDLFANDALVFKNTQIEDITLASDKSEHKIKLICKSWPYFGVWTKKGCDDFICLEPWFGIADNTEFKGNLSEKEGIVSLEPNRHFEVEFSLNFS